MNELRLGAVESQFADIVWQNAPLSTARLVELCAQRLSWKRTTTYTVLKRLCQRGLFRTENAVVSAILSRQEFYSMQSEQFVEQTFDGSLPAFVAAFASRKKLTEQEVSELRRMIDAWGEEAQR